MPLPFLSKALSKLHRFGFFIAIVLVLGSASPQAAAQTPGAVLSGTQSVTGASFAPGATVTYTVVLTNSGSGPQGDNPGDEFSETLPAGVTLVSANATGGTAGVVLASNRVTWNGALTAGETVTISIAATIAGAAGDTVNAQGVIGFDGDGDGTNDTVGATDDPALPGNADVTRFTAGTIEFTATQDIAGNKIAGQTQTFTVVITNTGTRTQLDNLTSEFLEILPTQFTLDPPSVSASTGTIQGFAGGGEDGGTIVWNGALAPDESVTITFSAMINNSAAGQIVTTQGVMRYDTAGNGVNDGTLYTDDPFTTEVGDANSFTLPAAPYVQLSAVQTVATTGAPGARAIYTLVITNIGNATQPDNPGDEFIETLPSDVSLVRATTNSGTASADINSNTVSWNGIIPAGYSITIRITAAIKEDAAIGTSISAQGQISYDYYVMGANLISGFTTAMPGSEPETPTEFTTQDFVGNGEDFGYVQGTGAIGINALQNDIGIGLAPAIVATTNGLHGTVTINADQTLTYTPTGPLPSGGDTFTYTVGDGFGGSYTITVSVRDFSDAASNFVGLTQPPVGGSPRNEFTGLLRVTLNPFGAFTGTLNLAGTKFKLSGAFDSAGIARFGRDLTPELILKRKVGRVPLPELHLSLQLPHSAGMSIVTGKLAIAGSTVAMISADRSDYSRNSPVLAPLTGSYTVLFPHVAAPNGGLDAAQYPQGSGLGRLTVSTNGMATLTGVLADGTKISCANPLSNQGDWALFVPIYKNKGSVSGTAHFRNHLTSDIDGANLVWIRPGTVLSARYPAGWPDPGIAIDLVGSKYVPAISFTSNPVEQAGNATLSLADGELPLPGTISISANIDAQNAVTFISPPAGLRPKLTIARTGLVKGSFIHPTSQKTSAIRGVILQKQSQMGGYFVGPTQIGGMAVTPK